MKSVSRMSCFSLSSKGIWSSLSTFPSSYCSLISCYKRSFAYCNEHCWVPAARCASLTSIASSSRSKFPLVFLASADKGRWTPTYKEVEFLSSISGSINLGTSLAPRGDYIRPFISNDFGLIKVSRFTYTWLYGWIISGFESGPATRLAPSLTFNWML